jgi:hypothetical protein
MSTPDPVPCHFFPAIPPPLFSFRHQLAVRSSSIRWISTNGKQKNFVGSQKEGEVLKTFPLAQLIVSA